MRWLPGPCLCLARPRVTSGQVEAALKTSGCEMERWSLSLFDPASYEENYRGRCAQHQGYPGQLPLRCTVVPQRPPADMAVAAVP